MDTIRRPEVTPTRQRELERLFFQMVCQCPEDLGEMLLIHDMAVAYMRSSVAMARAAGELDHLTDDRPTAVVSYLRPVETQQVG